MKKNKIFLLGNIVFAMSQWIILMILTKVGSLEQVGYYSLSLAYSAPFIVFANMQMRSIVATDTNNSFSFKEYFITRIIILIIMSLLFVSFLFFFLEGILVILTGVMYLVKVIESLTDLIFGEFQREAKLNNVGRSQIFRGIATVLVFGGSFLLYENLVLSITSVAIITLFRLTVVDYRRIANVGLFMKPKHKLTFFKKLLITSLPLGFVSLLNSLNTNIPRYVIEKLIGLDSLGIFTAISYFIVAGTILITPILNIYLTPLAKLYNKKDFVNYKKLTIKVINLLLAVSSFIILCSIVFGKQILILMYSNIYGEYHSLFIIISIATSISFFSALINSQMIVMKLYKIQPAINLILIIFVLFNSFILIPAHGIFGAAVVMLINYVIHIILVLSYIYMKYRRKAVFS